MAVHWDCSECQAYADAKAADDAADTEKGESDEWQAFAVMRESLIWALLSAKFPPGSWKITEKNWKEVFKRINMLERATEAWRTKPDAERKRRIPVYFKPDEIRSMIGMSVNAGDQTDRQFDKMLLDRLRRDTDQTLRYWEEAQEPEKA